MHLMVQVRGGPHQRDCEPVGARPGYQTAVPGYHRPRSLVHIRVAASQPVRRILFGPRSAVTIHLGRRSPDGSSGLPGVVGRAVLPLLGLAPGGACRATRVTPGAGALLPHRFTLACAPVARAIGGLLSVALSCGSPRLGVTQHRALWSPDVPRTSHAGPRPPGQLAATFSVRRSESRQKGSEMLQI